jgi:alanine racemase
VQPSPVGATSRLTIDLSALAGNWRALAALAPAAATGAAVKADGYGLGAIPVARALYGAGCRHFFVAHLSEALSLRPHLAADATVFVLHGIPPGTAGEFVAHGITPILNSLGDIEAWSSAARLAGRVLSAALQVDSGMNRMGLSTAEVDALVAAPERLAGIELTVGMSHLACADTPDHPLNAEQRRRFIAVTGRIGALAGARLALANSAGILLGPDFHFALTRPGIALYGANPTPSRPSPVAPVIRLEADILQVREIDRPEVVGYGAAHEVTGPTRVATVAVGYADGYLRAAGNRGKVRVAGRLAPILGRVSMDLMTIDVTDIPPALSAPGMPAVLVGDGLTIEEVAQAMGTVPYEFLTRLGSRFARAYVGGAS